MTAVMSVPVRIAIKAALAVLLTAVVMPAAARAVAAPRLAAAPDSAAADTALGQYLGGMSDSTTRYFGIAAEPTDTTGLDEVLDDSERETGRATFGVMPAFAFNRVDGATPGASVTITPPRRLHLGRLGGKFAYATGPQRALGGAEYQKLLHVGPHAFSLSLGAARSTARMNRDHFGRYLDTWRALVWGGDAARYLRADGFVAGLEHDAGPWRASIGFRDVLERPLATTTTWNLLHRDLLVPDNLPAVRGRAQELSLDADWRWGRLPLRTEVQGWSAGHGLGGDFDYRRVRVATGAELTAGRTLAIVPQFAYGRLTGDTPPQAAFYLGGGNTMRSIETDALGGTTFALARLDAVLVPDVLTLLRVHHPATLPLQVAAFGALGAVAGPDPYGDAGTPAADWPDRAAWRSEAGASLLYATSLLGEGGFLRASVAWPLGPAAGHAHVGFGVARGLDLLRPPSE